MLRIARVNRAGQGLSSWPVLLCFALGVLLPSAALLWFMNKAISNERLAITQKLLESYRAQLPFLQGEVAHFWLNLSNQAALFPADPNPAITFAAVTDAGLGDGAVVLSPEGAALYPGEPASPPGVIASSPEWLQAQAAEEVGDLSEAAEQFHQIAAAHPEPALRGPALLAQARCLQRARRASDALQVLQQLRDPVFSHTLDFSGRLLQPNAELAILELSDPSSPGFREVARGLAARVASYSGPPIPSSQRRFLMRELQDLTGGEITFPRYRAEQISAEWLFHHSLPTPGIQSTPGGDSLTLRTPHLLLIFRSATVRSNLLAALQPRLPAGLTLSLVPPRGDSLTGAIAAADAHPGMPGWKLALHLGESRSLDQVSSDQITALIWTGALVLAAMTLLALIAARLLTRQIQVTRLKNDLVASVTHELKTPLASTRLLVDTLLAQAAPDPKTTREYLELIARENARLTTLVQNFLAFSRMERNRHSFQFQPLDPAVLAQIAAEGLRDRLSADAADFQLHLEPNLPRIQGDADSLVTALLNLLDNALKYSGENRRIHLRVLPQGSNLAFEVEDNGIGIPPRECRKIFRRFYQVNQHARDAVSGCGLGLSIVDYIVRAHHGTIEVQSTQGRGSIFRVLLPASAPVPTTVRTEPACA